LAVADVAAVDAAAGGAALASGRSPAAAADCLEDALAPAVAGAGRAAVTSARGAISACLDASAAVAVALLLPLSLLLLPLLSF
jgi:hypothetical protein